jgi:hypothetical protein
MADVSHGSSQIHGTRAHDAADGDNPIKIGAVAKEHDGTNPGSVAENDRSDLRSDRNGRLFVNDGHPNDWAVNENHTTAQTNNALKAAPGAGLALFITGLILSTDTAMNIKIVRNTGGTPTDVLGPYYFAANGGLTMQFKTPVRINTNQNIAFTSSAAGNHTVTVTGYTAPTS